ncbi:MAG: nuclear transport factor 2 family protein [Terriglobales bacterium]
MRSALLLLGTVVFSLTLTLTQALAQSPSSKPLPAYDRQLIDQQKQFLQMAQAKDPAAVERAIADDFQGIGTNGDFYDKGELVEAAETGLPKDTRAYDFHVVKLNDDSAIVTYNLILPGEHPRYRHMADTWARIGGQWKLKFRQFTPNLWSATDLD